MNTRCVDRTRWWRNFYFFQRLLCFFFCIHFPFQSLFASPLIRIPEETEKVELHSSYLYWLDTSGKVDAENVEEEGDWRKSDDSQIIFPKQGNLWLKLSVVSDSDQEWVLHFPYPTTDSVVLYTSALGNLHPYKKLISERSALDLFVSSGISFPIQLKEKKQETLLIQLPASRHLILGSFLLSRDYNVFFEHLEIMIKGLVLGFLIFLFAWALILFGFQRDWVLLSLAIYCTFIFGALFFFAETGLHLILIQPPNFNLVAIKLLTIGAMMLLGFSWLYMRIGQESRSIWYLFLFLGLIDFFVFLGDFVAPADWQSIVVWRISRMILYVMIGLSVFLSFRGNLLARYYTLGSFVWHLGIFIYFLYLTQGLFTGLVFQFSLELSALLSTFVFFLGYVHYDSIQKKQDPPIYSRNRRKYEKSLTSSDLELSFDRLNVFMREALKEILSAVLQSKRDSYSLRKGNKPFSKRMDPSGFLSMQKRFDEIEKSVMEAYELLRVVQKRFPKKKRKLDLVHFAKSLRVWLSRIGLENHLLNHLGGTAIVFINQRLFIQTILRILGNVSSESPLVLTVAENRKYYFLEFQGAFKLSLSQLFSGNSLIEFYIKALEEEGIFADIQDSRVSFSVPKDTRWNEKTREEVGEFQTEIDNLEGFRSLILGNLKVKQENESLLSDAILLSPADEESISRFDNGKKSKILIVDDSTGLLKLFEQLLGIEFQLFMATNANKGLELARKEKPDAILLDSILPDLDWQDFIQAVRSEESLRLIPVVLMTPEYLWPEDSLWEPDDYVRKPLNFSELITRIRMQLNIVRLLEVIRLKDSLIQGDLQLVKEWQSNLLPRELPKVAGIEISSDSISFGKLGGDFFDIIVDHDKVIFLLLDVSGYGIPATLISSVAKMSIEELKDRATIGKNPAEILTYINEKLDGKILWNYFSTAICLELDVTNKKIRYSAAGHPPAYVFDSSGSEIHEIRTKGKPIGISGASIYTFEERTLKSGDIVVLYSDGLLEALETNTASGEENLKGIVKANSRKSTEVIAARFSEAARRTSQPSIGDDVSFLVIRV